MSNDTNTGAGKLIERILGDANAKAQAILNDQEASLAKLKASAERESASAKQTFEKSRDDAVKSVLERSRTNAELYARKQALNARRELLDKVFEQAYQQLCAFDENKSADVIKSMLLAESEGGEQILPSSADRGVISSLLSSVNEALKEKDKSPLTLSKDDASELKRGFILAGESYMKDCSFASLLRDARMLEETSVSSILFKN